ncbi:hypothetical protein IGI03_21630 [Bacillus thuringiensis]|uniref:hypothetical protein n=1 Tax=Bacillus thuringiensis TaxID=1428 RepID=UPI001876F8B9|nr:hypothetical protein [Bacillus thuringiensis]MBE5090626.1 hypothetical protein [Bacillus thuringiensis]
MHNVPDFLKNFPTDIIAISNDDKVIIEVKSKPILPNSKELENMENLIKQQASWRFELVITNSKNSGAEKLLESNYLRASFITVWSALETVVRSKLKNEKVKSINSNVLQSIKNLYTFGLVSTEEYDFP